MSTIGTRSRMLSRFGCVVSLICLLAISAGLPAAEPATPTATGQPLLVGWAGVDITPPRPVNLVGQHGKRISQGVDDPVTATVLALETKGATANAVEQGLLISMDICGVHMAVQDRVKEMVKSKLADFDADKLFLNATHTHTAPMQIDGFVPAYEITAQEQAQGVMTGSEYGEFLCEKLTEAAVRAWNGASPAASAGPWATPWSATTAAPCTWTAMPKCTAAPTPRSSTASKATKTIACRWCSSGMPSSS